VTPPWDVPSLVPVDSTLVIIEPSRGFGTGHHASTRLCLRALGHIDVYGARVLDLGTGSGVLAMAASLCGARAVTAIDIDPDAIEAARQSAALNPGVEKVEWLVGDFRDQSAPLAGPWDVVLANLTGGMLRSSADRLRALSAAGLLIASGFDEHERPDVEDALQMAVRAAYVEDGWIGLALSQPGAADSWRGAGSSPR
jgi:ribosomal protein L11 methyltransferase